jgi:hypothetical protein
MADDVEEVEDEREFEDEGGEDAACGKGCGQEPMGCGTCDLIGRGPYEPEDDHDRYNW